MRACHVKRQPLFLSHQDFFYILTYFNIPQNIQVKVDVILLARETLDEKM